MKKNQDRDMANLSSIEDPKPVETEIVKKNLILSILCKKFMNNRFSLEYSYRLSEEDLRSSTEKDLDKRIGNQKRINRYNELNWYHGIVRMEDLGPWPKMQGLDEILTKEDMIKTAQLVRNIDNLEIRQLIERLNSIRKKAEFIKARLKPVLVPGGSIREDKRVLRNEKVNNPRQIKRCPYDIEDGNTRCLAYSLEGLKKVEAYIGIKVE